jgi:hypothetical protein
MSQILILVRPVYALLVLRYLGGCSRRGKEERNFLCTAVRIAHFRENFLPRIARIKRI